MNIPLWAYALATLAALAWFTRVKDAADDPDLFHVRSRTGSLLHGAIWMAALVEHGLADNGALLYGAFGVNMFFCLFYVMCMRRADAPD